MNAIASLEQEYLRLKFGFGNGEACVEWATERLQCDEENGDLEVVLLSAAKGRAEVLPLVEAIVDRYCGAIRTDEEYCSGRYIAALRDDYLNGRETVSTLDEIFTSLYSKLNYPNWLGMLMRNCEYATDIPIFQKPFEDEFEYIASLWNAAASKEAFYNKYDYSISLRHDAQLG
jgi:hypothetical protein